MKKEVKLSRRQLLQWSTPAITAVTLPAHAQMSPDDLPVEACSAEPPLLTVLAPSKCSGNPPVGTAVIEITSGSEVDVEITAISVTTSDPKSDISSIPDVPFMVSETSGETVTYIGPASDAVACLPLADVTLTIEYRCEDEPPKSMEYDITQLLVDAVP